jgi:hypothetical protein
VIGPVPDTGGGALGAARLAGIVKRLQSRLVPERGKQTPIDANGVHHPKVPMSDATDRRLRVPAEREGVGGRKISPMQIAAHILEEALVGIPEDLTPRSPRRIVPIASLSRD